MVMPIMKEAVVNSVVSIIIDPEQVKPKPSRFRSLKDWFYILLSDCDGVCDNCSIRDPGLYKSCQKLKSK